MASGPASQEASCRQRDSDRKKERKRENTGVRRRISTQDEMKRSHSPVLNVDLCADKNSHPEFGPSSVILVLSWAAGHETHTHTKPCCSTTIQEVHSAEDFFLFFLSHDKCFLSAANSVIFTIDIFEMVPLFSLRCMICSFFLKIKLINDPQPLIDVGLICLHRAHKRRLRRRMQIWWA